MVEVLLAGNASPLQLATDGSTAYSLAVQSGRKVVSAMLAEAATLHGIQYNQLNAVLDSLRQGGFANLRNQAGWTPLIFAAALNNLEAAQEILQLGADPNVAENDQWIALHFAVDQNSRDLVSLLLTAGSNPDFINKNGETPRGMAQSRGLVEILELFDNHTDKTAEEAQ